MSKITLNFDGDVNIFVNEKNGMLESLLLDGLSDYPDDTLEIDLDVDLEDADANATALYALPWQLLAAPATLYEILSQLISCCDLDSMEPMPLEDTFILFDSELVTIDDDGDCVLLGPGVVVKLGDTGIVSLSDSEIEQLVDILEAGTVTLFNGHRFGRGYVL